MMRERLTANEGAVVDDDDGSDDEDDDDNSNDDDSVKYRFKMLYGYKYLYCGIPLFYLQKNQNCVAVITYKNYMT